MSLNGSLQVGRSALLTSQAALQVAGDNMANAATRGFHRRTVHLSPMQGQMIAPGQFVGTGVQLSAIRREVDIALQSRFRDSVSQEQALLVDQRFLSSLETIQNELTDNDLSTLLSSFFNSFSELANNPNDNAIRSVVIQQGQTLADRVSALRSEYSRVSSEIDRSLELSVTKANDLLGQIAMLNGRITSSEVGQGEAASLRDQRDVLLDELAQHIDISVIDHGGAVDVLVGSTPVLLGGQSRGIELRTTNVDGGHEVSLRVAADGTRLSPRSGTIGGLMRQREGTVEDMVQSLNDFAGQLIHQVNRLHSQGQSAQGFASVQGTYQVTNTAAALNSDAAGLPFDIRNGSFFLHVTHAESGVRTAHEIRVSGEMSLDDVINEINTVVGVPNVHAGISGGKLTLTAEPGYTMSFSDDSSGALAALGVNTFFTGDSAASIGINQKILDDPTALVAGAGHVAGSNDTAMAIAALQDTPLSALGNKSLREHWQASVTELAVKTNAANAGVESAQLVRSSLDAQMQGVSGVSLDEESINLLLLQRQFQAAARFIGVIDETMRTLLSM